MSKKSKLRQQLQQTEKPATRVDELDRVRLALSHETQMRLQAHYELAAKNTEELRLQLGAHVEAHKKSVAETFARYGLDLTGGDDVVIATGEIKRASMKAAEKES